MRNRILTWVRRGLDWWDAITGTPLGRHRAEFFGPWPELVAPAETVVPATRRVEAEPTAAPEDAVFWPGTPLIPWWLHLAMSMEWDELDDQQREYRLQQERRVALLLADRGEDWWEEPLRGAPVPA